MLAGRDRIVDNDRTRAFVARLASADTTTIEYPEAHHTLEFEPDPGQYARDLISWIEGRWPDPRDRGDTALDGRTRAEPSRSRS